ncbi:MAG: rod shape-determining protein RodA [Bacteroidales bacterium]|nr:rod shape-determining protein RodA [Bacteroidales bacterium]
MGIVGTYRNGEYKKIDYLPIFLYAAIVIFGWCNIFSASRSEIFSFAMPYGKQLIWIGIAAIVAFVVLFIEPRFFSNTAYIFYGLGIVLLVATLIFGREVNGAKSWLYIGGVGMQSTEFAKVGTALALAKYLSGQDIDMKRWRTWAVIGMILLVPMGLIICQHDVGSMLVFVCFIIPLYRFGFPRSLIYLGLILLTLFVFTQSGWFGEKYENYIIIGIVVLCCLFYLFAYVGKPTTKQYLLTLLALALCSGFVLVSDKLVSKLDQHQQDRIKVLFDPTYKLDNEGYNVHQAKIAIGSGGFAGKGFMGGTVTNAHFVPEQHTDFIFCTVGEEYGFIGAGGLLLAYLWLLQHLVTMAERQASVFGRFYGYSVSAVFFTHVFINVAMVVGLMPCIGIPLPFLTYGGTSLVAFTLLLFIFIRMDANHTSLL